MFVIKKYKKIDKCISLEEATLTFYGDLILKKAKIWYLLCYISLNPYKSLWKQALCVCINAERGFTL